nr:hypothetical protein [Tanacetum cinerariifolium]
MACSLPHTVDEIHVLVQKLIHKDGVRQKAMMDLAVQFDNASAAKHDLRKGYEKCNNIPQETRTLIDTFLKQEFDKDYEMNLAIYRNTAKIEKQIETKYVWLSENTNFFYFPTTNTNSFHYFFHTFKQHFKNSPCLNPTKAIPRHPENQLKQSPNNLTQPPTTTPKPIEVVRHQNNIHITPHLPLLRDFLLGKYHQLLRDEEVLRETLKEQAKTEKEEDDRIKKEQTEHELFMLEFGVQSDSEYESY